MKIFGNTIDKKTLKQAKKSKEKYVKRYGDDSKADYKYATQSIDTLDFMNTKQLVMSDTPEELAPNALVVGNIRMGFGHYRISMAIASCANALGYTPYWFDIAGYDSTGSKMIREQNRLYSMASRLSQKSRLFNKFFWEPLNSEGFKQITYNAKDQKNSELLVPMYKNLPKDVPFVATHVWPAQGAVHAGFTHVVNAIPDNWPMALHLAEGSIHTVQTSFAYNGYKMLSGFSKRPLNGIPSKDLKMVGRYVDHELLVNLEEDNRLRIERAENGKPVRFLLTVGGAGAGFKLFLEMVKHLIPYVEKGKAAVFINFGDHEDVYNKMQKALGNIKVRKFFNDYEGLKNYVSEIRNEDAHGITAICDENIFRAVYATNLLMPVSDILVTKPSELAFYPIPKIFMKHIGGHEVYGAIASQEAGDGTFECPTKKTANAMIDRLIADKELFINMCQRINVLKARGVYNGGYECVKLAAKGYQS